MPFTISHAGFVLPLKGNVSPSILCGLMIGSIAPDFAYFVREFGVASFAHTVTGALLISLPVGVVMYLLVKQIFKKIAKALPMPHSSYLMSWNIDKPLPKPSFLPVMLAILLGALFHNFVDSFTHESGSAVSMFPILKKEILSIDGESIHVFRMLQYLGSILGMVMLVISYCLGLARYCQARKIKIWQDKRSWLIHLSVTTITIILAAFINARHIPKRFDVFDFRVFGFKFLITWLPIIGVAFLLVVLFRNRFLSIPRQQVALEHSSNDAE